MEYKYGNKDWDGQLTPGDIIEAGFYLDEDHDSFMGENPELVDYRFLSTDAVQEFKLKYINWWAAYESHRDEKEGSLPEYIVIEQRLVQIKRKRLRSEEYDIVFSADIKNKEDLAIALRLVGFTSMGKPACNITM